MSSDWWQVVHGAELAQGDLLKDCPVFRIESPDGDEAVVTVEEHDVIVLTQSCDLENGKVDDVLVARVVDYVGLVAREGASKPHIKSSDFRNAAVANTLTAYLLLHERAGDPSMGWALVDFHNLFSVPKAVLSSFAEHAGDRLRLSVPYREHLAQSFARYMARVGLPVSPEGFRKAAPPA